MTIPSNMVIELWEKIKKTPLEIGPRIIRNNNEMNQTRNKLH